MSVKQLISLTKETYSRWDGHKAPRWGASVAFYSILSFAPLLVLLTAIIALAFGHTTAQSALIGEARELIGERGAQTVTTLLKSAQRPASGLFASVVAFITLLFGASGVFIELQEALNTMWDTNNPTSSGVMGMIKQRLFSFGMVLSVGFLLLVSMLISTALTYIGHFFGELVPLPPFILQAINFVVSFAVISALFALMLKYVPAARISWRDVSLGAIGTALLFTIGKMLVGLYLGKASVGSTYGAAGSLVAVIVWIYYSAQIFFFGAEFTHVYAEARAGKTGSQLANQQKNLPGKSLPTLQQSNEASWASQSIGTETAPAATRSLRSGGTIAHISPQGASVTRSQATASAEPEHVYQTSVSRLNAKAAAANMPATKPRVLVALGLGFLMGRLFSGIGKSERDA